MRYSLNQIKLQRFVVYVRAESYGHKDHDEDDPSPSEAAFCGSNDSEGLLNLTLPVRKLCNHQKILFTG